MDRGSRMKATKSTRLPPTCRESRVEGQNWCEQGPSRLCTASVEELGCLYDKARLRKGANAGSPPGPLVCGSTVCGSQASGRAAPPQSLKLSSRGPLPSFHRPQASLTQLALCRGSSLSLLDPAKASSAVAMDARVMAMCIQDRKVRSDARNVLGSRRCDRCRR